MADKALVPVEQKQVLFYDDEVTAVLAEDGTVYVPIRLICDHIGVNVNSQRQRIRRDPVLSDVMMSGVITTPNIEPGSRRPQTSTMLCLPLDYLNGWLFGISANRVKPELRERIIRYQRECYKVLAEAFQEGRLTADPTFDELLAYADDEAVQAYQMAQAIVKLARNQIMIEARLTGRLDDHEQRLETIEVDLGHDDRRITESQATEISQAIRAIALTMSKRSKQNEYGRTWGEFYRKFGVSKYRHLPAARFDEAMKWLTDWHQDLVGDVPF